MLYGPWRDTHPVLRFIGFPRRYRNRYASPSIGGGWDGWEWDN